MFQQGCPFRDRALASLNRLGRPYRLANTSASISGILAAVTAGLAVTVLCRSILPPGVRPLGAEEGFPPLPTASIPLHRGSRISAVAECLAGFMREGFSMDTPPVAPVASTRAVVAA